MTEDQIRIRGQGNPRDVRDRVRGAENGRSRSDNREVESGPGNRLTIESSSFSSVLITTNRGKEIEFTLPGGTSESVSYRGNITEIDSDGEVRVKVNGRVILNTMPSRPKGSDFRADVAIPPEARGGLSEAARNIGATIRENPVETGVGAGVLALLIL